MGYILITFLTFLNLALCGNNKFLISSTPCLNDGDCEPGGSCRSNFCHFKTDENYEKVVVVVVTKIGEKCETDQNCNIERTMCKNGTCQCVDGTTKSANNKVCLNVSSGIGDKCEENVQCSVVVPWSICQNQKCICDSKRHNVNGACFKTKGLDQYCDTHEECLKIDFSQCVDNKCKCIRRYVSDKNRCLLIAKGLKSTCFEDIQCTTALGYGAHCINGFCMCKDTFMYKSLINKCVQDMRFGDKCDTDTDCHEKGKFPNRLGCIKGECQCKPYYRNQNGHCKSSGDKNSRNLFLFLLVSLPTLVANWM